MNSESNSAIFSTSNVPGALVETGVPEIPGEEQERAQLRALATKFNVTLMPSASLLSVLGSEITSNMIQRIGDKVFQMSSFTLRHFSKALLEEYLPESCRQENEDGSTAWLMDTVEKVMFMVPILSAASDSSCKGLTRCFRSKTQRVVRVVATLMPDLEISYVPIDSDVGVVTVNSQYALSTEHGEMHCGQRIGTSGRSGSIRRR